MGRHGLGRVLVMKNEKDAPSALLLASCETFSFCRCILAPISSFSLWSLEVVVPLNGVLGLRGDGWQTHGQRRVKEEVMRAGRFGQEETTYLTASVICSRREGEGQANGNNLRLVS